LYNAAPGYKPEDKFIYLEDHLIIMAGGTTNDVIFKKLKMIENDVELIGDNLTDMLLQIFQKLGIE